jgi:hypothetical protein
MAQLEPETLSKIRRGEPVSMEQALLAIVHVSSRPKPKRRHFFTRIWDSIMGCGLHR